MDAFVASESSIAESASSGLSISGRVTNLVGEPLQNANISVSGSGSSEARTDKDEHGHSPTCMGMGLLIASL